MNNYKKLAENILENGILIGSRKWGGSYNHSDYDLVFNSEDTEKLIDFLESRKIKFGLNDGMSGRDKHTMYNKYNLKVHLDGKMINVIGYDSQFIPMVKELNEFMEVFSKFSSYENIKFNKDRRIEIVETFINNWVEFNLGDKKNDFLTDNLCPEIDIDEDDIPF